jgi:hypothetical protein
MSIRVVEWVLAHSPAKHAERLVLIVLASHAHDDGSNAFPSVDRISGRAKLSRRSVLKALKSLRAAGAIEGEARPGRATTYSVLLTGGASTARVQESHGRSSDTGGVQSPTGGVQRLHPNR